MSGPAINVAAWHPEGAVRSRLFPIQVEPFGTNEVKISIDGVARIVKAHDLVVAMHEALDRFRKAAARGDDKKFMPGMDAYIEDCGQ